MLEYLPHRPYVLHPLLLGKVAQMALGELQNSRYHPLRPLGSGGMGEVYLMQDMRVRRQVAIKVLRSESDMYPESTSAGDAARLFQREARAIAALDHPNILPLYDFGEELHEGTTISYMVMPFCSEGSLASWLRQRGNESKLSRQDISLIVEQAADALQYAHDLQMIHLDVKPSNFLLRGNAKNPNRPTLLLADFGIARSSATAASSSRTVRGTPSSMAPEQWTSQPVPASDQYALAVLVYELLAGRLPFVGGMEQLMYQHFQAQPAPPSTYNAELPAAVDAVLLRALAKKPEDRFPSISAFAAEFVRAMQQGPEELAIGPQEAVGGTMRYTLAISLAEAQSGTHRVITLPGGQRVTVTIPAGVSEGEVISVPGADGSPVLGPGLLLTIAITRSEELPAASNAAAEATLISSSPAAQQPSGPVVVQDLLTIPAPAAQQSQQQRSGPPVDHNLPTMAAAGSPPAAGGAQGRSPRSGGRSSGRLVAIVLAVVILLSVAVGVLIYRSHQTGASSIAGSQTGTTQAKQGVTPAGSATVAVTATPPPGLFIAGTYNGSMYTQSAQQTTPITLIIKQKQGSGSLSGTYTQASNTGYQLRGKVDLQGNFSFTVQQPGGSAPLFFHGSYQQNFLKGNFCNSRTGSCSADAGYFNVGPRY
jgi:eukaryotic-like serine/threonine-protein kinase